VARLRRAAGKRPGAFPRAPFAAPVRKISAYIVFTFARPAFIGRRRVAAADELAALLLGIFQKVALAAV